MISQLTSNPWAREEGEQGAVRYLLPFQHDNIKIPAVVLCHLSQVECHISTPPLTLCLALYN
eukprot:514121-Karenia_brevis.AAC.1